MRRFGQVQRAASAIEGLERRLLFAAAVRTVSLVADPLLSTGTQTGVAVDAAGDVYATRYTVPSEGEEVVRIPAGSSTPTTLASFDPLGTTAGAAQVPTGRLVLDAAGNLYGLTNRYPISTTQANATLGILWELPAGSGTVKALATFTAATGVPTSLTTDTAGDLFGTANSTDGENGAVFVYPAGGAGGLTTVPIGGPGDEGYHLVADAAGNVFGERATSHSYATFDVYEIPHGATAATAATTLATASSTSAIDVEGIAIDATDDVYLTTSDGRLLQVPAGTGQVRTAATSPGGGFVGDPLVDGSGALFVALDSGTTGNHLDELPAGGGTFTPVVDLDDSPIAGLAIDATGNLYGDYTDNDTSTVFEVTGGPATPVTAAPTPTPTPTPSPTPTPTPTPSPTPTPTATGLVPTVGHSTVSPMVVAGAKVKGTVAVSVANTAAAAAAGTATVTLYATPVGSTTATDGTRLASVSRKLKVAAGGTAALTVPVRAASLAAGTYTLRAVATDAAGTVLMSEAGPTLTVAAPTVLLSASVAATPTSAAAGRSLTLVLTLANGGNVSSTGLLSATLALTTDGSTAAVPLGTVRRGVTVKAGGKPVVLKLRVRLPATATPGNYQPLVSIVQGTATAAALGLTPVTVTAAASRK